MANRAKPEKGSPPERQNAQGEHEGMAHTPDEFDVMNPERQGLGDRKPAEKPGKPKPA